MKILFKKSAKKISHNLTLSIKAIFKSKGIILTEKEFLKIENNFFKILGGKKNERKN